MPGLFLPDAKKLGIMYRFTGTCLTPNDGPFADLPAGSIKVLQITDSHLYADPSQCLLGLNTLNTLDQVLAQAQKQLGMPDLILATGDLVHDASDAGYKRLRSRLSQTGCPAYCLPGNHDLASKMVKLLNQDGVHCIPSVQYNGWQLLFLDSTIPKQTGGNLNEAQLIELATTLANQPALHTLICLHHQPVPVGSQWIDSIGLDNSSDLFGVINQHPQVKGILWGHVHQLFESRQGHVKLMATPSTCIQFAAGQDDFAIDHCPPGYRWLALLPSGEIHSGVELLSEMPSGLDLASMGY
jgi:Icc protein